MTGFHDLVHIFCIAETVRPYIRVAKRLDIICAVNVPLRGPFPDYPIASTHHEIYGNN